MRLHGYCIDCHRLKLVTVSGSSLNRGLAQGRKTPIGTCWQCEEGKQIIRTPQDLARIAPFLNPEQCSWVYETIVRGSRNLRRDNRELQLCIRDATRMPRSESSEQKKEAP